eukprot:Rmarinus@m.21892
MLVWVVVSLPILIPLGCFAFSCVMVAVESALQWARDLTKGICLFCGGRYGHAAADTDQLCMFCGGSAICLELGTELAINLKQLDISGRPFDELYKLYKVGSILGTGSFSEVRMATHRKSKKKVAVKIIDMKKLSDDVVKRYVLTEVNVLRRSHHPHILSASDVFVGPSKLALCLDYLSGGELFDQLANREHYSEMEAARLIHAITSGLAYLHAHGIVHRDLKPENIVFSSKSKNARVVIADFGLARILQSPTDVMSSPVGTPGYLAPEIYDAMESNAPYTRAVDSWSLGVITYILLSGRMPFDEDRLSLDEPVSFSGPSWQSISGAAKDFVARLLERDPLKRMTAMAALSH